MNRLYQHNLTLLTDLYQLTMAYGYWKNRYYHHDAVFHLFFRKNPFKGDFAIAAGLENVIDYLQNLKFSIEDIRYLQALRGADNQPLFEEAFLNYLQRMAFTCDVAAVPEGTIVFPHQPLLRIKGNLIQAQLIETALLTLVNFPILIATKAARIVNAAKGDTVLEFGLRRAQGIDGGITASRAAYIGGCHATSNVLAGKLFGIPVKGTHAHSWVMCFENEPQAFMAYAKAMPNNCVFLVDTYDTIEGVKQAIEVGKWLKREGHEMLGIRLDSGDLADLSINARQLLDAAGFKAAQIVASNNLDEYRIATLKRKGAKIAVWGVGTRLATAYEQPALGGVYKLAAIRENLHSTWTYKIKLSEQAIKVSNPGILQVARYVKNQLPVGDVIYDEEKFGNSGLLHCFDGQIVDFKPTDEHKSLLVPIFQQGQLIYKKPTIHEIRQHTLSQLALFEQIDTQNYPVGLEKKLYQAKRKMIGQHAPTSGEKRI